MSRRSNKKYYILLVILSIVGISIGYAVLNTTLNITGKSSISKNTWNVHFENVQIKDGSVEATKVPTIENSTTVDFETQLNLPGDFYEFTVDVVNNGTIDALIESITKEPELTSDQQKYLNYIIEYQNGEQIASKQLVKANEFVRLKVRVELKKDIATEDLPEVGDVLNLGFTLNYVQSDGTGSSVNNNGMKVINVVSGDGTQTSDEVCIKDECFYVISSTDDTVTMLAKYNLYIGNECTSNTFSSCIPYGEEATGKQDSNMIGYGRTPRKGITEFSNTNYWSSTVSSYPSYVYDSNSILYSYVENYKTYLSTLGVTPSEARLITYEELTNLGCNGFSCSNAPSWVYATSYWSGSANTSTNVWRVNSYASFNNIRHSSEYDFGWGCRPVIIISKSNF